MSDQIGRGRRFVVYRMYDREGVLLYVGKSMNLALRIIDHRSQKSWWPQVVRIDVEHFDSQVTASRAESDAIRTLHPKYNVMRYDSLANGIGPKISAAYGVAPLDPPPPSTPA